MNVSSVCYVAISVATVVILIVILVRVRNNKEGYKKCICSEQSGRGRTCQDTVQVNNDYVNNVWTESSLFPNKDWSTVSPGDGGWPVSKGCPWSN